MILSENGWSFLMNQNKISKELFEETLVKIFKKKFKGGKNQYEILELMKKNMKSNNKTKSKTKIKKLINYFLKEFWISLHRTLFFFLLCKLILAHFSSRNLNEVHSLSKIPLFSKYFILGIKDVLLSIKKKLVEELWTLRFSIFDNFSNTLSLSIFIQLWICLVHCS